MSALWIKNITKSYLPGEPPAVKDITISLDPGKILALLGESGSGKTTLLRVIAGLEYPEEGQININDKTIVGKGIFEKPEKRNIGFVFQHHALFPHLTVFENIAFGLSGKNKEERKSIVADVLQLVNLPGLSDRYPHQLSGGQQQRVALARALAPQPSLILLDEPFSNLDNVLKDQVREEIRNIIKKAGTTAIFVTHDTFDALQIADEVAFMKDGRLIQVDSPFRIYHQPVNEIVGGFFGKINTIQINDNQGKCISDLGEIIDPPASIKGKTGKLLFRPEQIVVDPKGIFEGKINSIHFMGDHNMVTMKITSDRGKAQIITFKSSITNQLEPEEHICFNIDLSEAILLE